jgi:hypothetical protein
MIGLNYLYKFTFYEKDLQKHSDIINLVRKVINDSSEIIYLGESSNITFREDDNDKSAISDFISDHFPKRKFGTITKEASHAGIYYELLRHIPEKSNVKTVILTLNLRSFDASWIYSDLETPLQKSIVLLKNYPPLVNRLLLSFRGYDIKTNKEREKQFKNKWKNDVLKFPYPFKYSNVIEWDKAMFQNGIRNTDNSINFPKTELACHYIKTYAFQIDTLTNPRIKDFDKIVKLAKKRGWHLILNLLAENMDMADSLIGKELTFLIKQNRDLLIKRYYKEGVYVVDNLYSIRNEYFIDQKWTTEHYSEKGRRIVAKNVAECLKAYYPADYVDVSADFKAVLKQSDFTNDCEGSTIWGQMQTLSSDRFFSGSKSSKTGQKQDYSITFERAIKYMPDSLKLISIEFMIFQTVHNPDAKLIVELSGKNIEYRCNEFLIKDLSQNLNSWERIKKQFQLPANFYNGDLIKIYVYNPTIDLLFLDDFKILFEK